MSDFVELQAGVTPDEAGERSRWQLLGDGVYGRWGARGEQRWRVPDLRVFKA